MCSMCLWIRLRDIGPARTEVRGLHLGQQCPATWLGVIFALPQLEVHIYNYIQCIIVYIHTRLYYILLYIYIYIYIYVCVHICIYYICVYVLYTCVCGYQHGNVLRQGVILDAKLHDALAVLLPQWSPSRCSR